MKLREALKIYVKNGGHFFDEATMNIFGSKLESELFHNRCFVTSEYSFDGTARFYNIRRFSEDYTKIEQLEEFNEISSLEEAVKIAADYKLV